MYTHTAPLAATVAALRGDHIKLHAYVDQVCDRIERTDPQVEALLSEPNRRARLHGEADQLLARFPDAADRPPLFGALLGVKDILQVDGFVTRAGSQIPPELIAGQEAGVVRQLRQAGALIVGKTVTTEFAYFEPGPTRNPHHLNHTPGGSSSGSAAGVAAGFCTLSIGTQTIGSVIRPAAFCGIIGYKPSYDRIDTSGVLYFSRTVDHVGLFTQDLAGMRLAASAVVRDWRAEIGALRRPVLAVPAGPYLAQMERDAMLAFEMQVQRLAWGGGLRVIRLLVLSHIQSLNQLHRRLAFAEFAHEHAEIYAEHADRYRPRTREIIEIGKTVSAAEIDAARLHCLQLRNELHEQMDTHEVSLWVMPAATGPAPEGIHATGNPDMNLPWTHAGMPTITLPAGKAENGLPLGLQFAGRFGQDEELFGWAERIEAALKRTE